jgi:glucose-6-phosphate isomerase
MAEPAARIDQTPEWEALRRHQRELAEVHLRELFAADPARGETMTCEAGDLYLDWSKQRVTAETIGLLVALAERAGLRRRIDAMFGGERINRTEDRAVLHVALRAPEGSSIEVGGHDVVPDVHEVLGRMRAFADEVRSGRWLGYTGKPIRNIVNIGIGGSDWARPWPTRRCCPTPTGRGPSGSSPTSTGPTSPRRPATWTRPRPCSSSAPRPSPPSRP